MDLNNGGTLSMKGDVDFKFSDVFNGDQGMTMMVMLGGGSKSSIGVPFMIFQNPNSSYPILGVADNIPGVVYRSGPRCWMDSRVFCE